MRVMLKRTPEYAKVERVKIYRNTAAWRQLASRHGVNRTPTLVLIADGEEKHRMRGWRGPQDVEAMWRKALERM